MKKALFLLFVVVLAVAAGLAIFAWQERERLSAAALSRALAPYGVTVTQLRGIRLGRGHLRLTELQWRMTGSPETYWARDLEAYFRLTPFHLKRLALADTQLWVPEPSAAEKIAPLSVAQLVQQWQGLPVGEVRIDRIRIDRQPPIGLHWQRTEIADVLEVAYQDLVVAGDIGRAALMSLDMQLRRSDQLLLAVDGQLQVGTGASHALNISGRAELAPLWQLSRRPDVAALLPDNLSAYIERAAGTTAFSLATQVNDDPAQLPSAYSVEILPGAALALALHNLPPELTAMVGGAAKAALVAEISKPAVLVWGQSLEQLKADGITLNITLPKGAASMAIAVNSVVCTAADNCGADISVRSSARALHDGGLKVAAPQLHCAGKLLLQPALVNFSAVKTCHLKAQTLALTDTVMTAAELQLTNTSWYYTPATKKVRLKGTEALLQAAKIQQADAAASGLVRLRKLRAAHVINQKVNALSFDATFNTEKLSISLPGQWLPAAQAKGTLSVTNARVGIDGELRSAADKSLLGFDLSHRLDNHHGSGRVDIKTEQFDLGDRKLSKRLRGWPYPADIVAGTVTGGVDLNWQLPPEGLQWQGRGEFRLNEIAGKFNDIAAIGVGGKIRVLIDNGELRSEVPAELRIARIDVGLPITEIAVDVMLNTAQSRYQINSLDARLLGGSVHGGAYEYVAGKDNDEPWEMTLNGILLERVLDLAAFDSVAGQGRIDGFLPLKITGTTVTISDGWLAGREPGVLRYVSATGKAVAAANDSLSLVSEALSNYHYETLRADASLNRKGDLKLAVVMRGVNPEMRGGQRINLNLNLENNIPSLLKTLQAGRIVDDMLEQQLKKRR